MPLLNFKHWTPKISAPHFIAPDAWLTGNVEVGKLVSIFFGSVLRGDINAIRVGDGTNIQEGALLHTSTGLGDCIVGDNVTVGHHAILHGCTIAELCIIGMGATVLDGAQIGKHCIIGANSLVTMNTVIPEGSMAFGAPAKVVRRLSPGEIDSIAESAQHYRELGAEYSRCFE
ncbi:MAG: gamma carbonic anhydrase family protein [Oligoflexia bacterium]|nr:gamma carbonic anhydrase family protein [Oligoflexia bacterium]